MGNDRIGSDEDNRIGKLQILKCVSRGVEAVALLVGHDLSRHAETGIAVHIGL